MTVVHNAVTPSFAPSDRAGWQREYRRRLAVTDLLVITGAVAGAQIVRFGATEDAGVVWAQTHKFVYTAVSAAIVGLWAIFLSVFNSRSARVIGGGAEEYRRIAIATFALFGSIAIASLLVRAELARGYLAIALPAGLIGLIVNRWVWRRVVARKRVDSQYLSSVLVVGAHYAARATATAFAREPMSGFRVVGVCTPDGPLPGATDIELADGTVPIVGTDLAILDAVERTGADTVALTATDDIGPGDIRRLVWDLEPLGVDLIVTPGIVDVAGQRMQTRPVAGMPMLHIEKPQHDRARSLSKTIFDMIFAIVVVLILSPVILVSAAAVKLTSSGPIFYRSERIGLNGKPFQMIKFRSMIQDADAHLDALLAENEGNGVLFKMREDPRVTKVGKFLRRYSLDELPQFFNVLRGEMSVVGPRPPLRREVDQYSESVRRRMMVKPGVTGLWQVSGRSDLSWNESVRLDLSYIENWSMIGDLMIIKRTISAVAGSDGAY